ncbi:MAG: amidohydrolase [Clostridiaceae bacterium]|nr:amidohydrolase family protein [Eubacteriales bacterium]NLV48092.1 amidohydrolase [Clostridiaceae bacterium]
MDYEYNSHDLEAAKKLDDFLPDRIFDAHMHIHDNTYLTGNKDDGSGNSTHDRKDVNDYLSDMRPLLGANRNIQLNTIIHPDRRLAEDAAFMSASDKFLVGQLELYPENVGEIVIFPRETTDDIRRRIVHPRIRGLKCYHVFADRPTTWDAYIEEYLPESAWEIADEKNLAITLHMVRDKALADPGNLSYIQSMSKRYPNAILILAHAARSFAAWTAIESVEALRTYENVWFDFSAICESPAMIQILKTVGVSRCMWGSDYPVSCFSGKAISIGDSFYWIYNKDLERFKGATKFNSWQVGTENLMAVRQACIIRDLSRNDIEKLFFSNAENLFRRNL